MIKKVSIFTTIILLTLLGCSQKASYSDLSKKWKYIPMKDFFENPVKTGFNLSPSGKLMTFMKPYKDQMNIYIQPTDDVIKNSDKNVKQLTFFTKKDKWISNFFFKGDDYIIFSQDNFGDENHALYKINILTKKITQLTPTFGDTDLPKDDPNRSKTNKKYKTRSYVTDGLTNTPNEILVSMNKRDPFAQDVYRLNVKSGKYSLIQKNPGNILYYGTDWDGEIRLGYSMKGTTREILYRSKGQKKYVSKVKFTYKDTFSPQNFHKDNSDWMYVMTNLPHNDKTPRDKIELVIYDFKKNKEVKTLFKLDNYDVSGSMSFSEKRRAPEYLLYVTHKRLYKFFDSIAEEQIKQMYKEIKKLGFDEEVRIASSNKEENIFIVTSFSDRNYGNTYIYNANTKQFTLFYNVNKKISPKDLVEMKPYSYPSRDGKFTINGYLFLPYGLSIDEAQNIPMVVNPHGGPWHRDMWGFNSVGQFLANRGYAVLLTNFRGSTGYGKNFLEASYKQWGQDMQDDITDGVLSLIKKGVADPKNICIYGGSYGGYAALAGVTFTPDLYACGIDAFGPANLITNLKSYPPQWKLFKKQAAQKIGDLENPDDLKMLKKYSPFFHADKIKVPMLIAQGGQDVRVPKEESEQIVSALKKNNVKYEYFYKENEGHGFAQLENRLEFYTKIETFLHNHIKGRLQ